MSDEHPQRIDDSEVHSVFGLLRARATRAASGLRSRVEDRLRRVGHTDDADPGMMRVAISALLQTTNLIFGMFGHSEEEEKRTETDDDDA